MESVVNVREKRVVIFKGVEVKKSKKNYLMTYGH